MEEEKEEEAGTSFWKARNFRPPDPPAPGVQTSPERANSLDSPEPGRNLPGTSGARNFRPHPELPACLRAKTRAKGPCIPPLTYPFVG